MAFPQSVISTDHATLVAIVADVIFSLADNFLELQLLYADDEGSLDDFLESILCGEYGVFFCENRPPLSWEAVESALSCRWAL